MKVMTFFLVALLASHAAIAQRRDVCARSEFVFVQPAPTQDTRPIEYSGGTIHVDRKPIATSAELTEVRAVAHDKGTVQLKFQPAAAERLTRATT